jgi:O-Antigen ligase
MKAAATGLDSSVAAPRTRPQARSLAPAQARERSVRRRVGWAWGLLVFNSLTYYSSITHLPSSVGKGIAQAALPLALVLALSVNRRVIVRPNVFLCLVSLLVVGALVTTLQPQHLGTVYRTVRLAEFIAALWLLTPWWGRRDMLLLRYHLVSYSVLLGSVVLGLLVAPGHALTGGRLAAVLWYIPPTEVAHYAAVMLGVVVVLWLCGHVRGRPTLAVVAGTGIILILTHTRTALVGLVAGLLVAGLSLIAAKARVRKLFAAAGAVTAIAIMTLSSFITAWLARGEGAQQLSDLTGRTLVWGPLLAYPRDTFQEIFGFGLSNSSFNGLPIDSNWLSSYEEQGLFGVVICAITLLFLLVTAYFQPRSLQRALALFLITYSLVASFTQDGFTDASTYLLELALAASLLVPPVAARRQISV